MCVSALVAHLLAAGRRRTVDELLAAGSHWPVWARHAELAGPVTGGR
jgi:hypothetical protein